MIEKNVTENTTMFVAFVPDYHHDYGKTRGHGIFAVIAVREGPMSLPNPVLGMQVAQASRGPNPDPLRGVR
jgi:hypothetical protein